MNKKSKYTAYTNEKLIFYGFIRFVFINLSRPLVHIANWATDKINATFIPTEVSNE